MMPYACNPSYLRGADLEDCSLRPVRAKKKLARPHLNKLIGCGGTCCNSSYIGSTDRRFAVQGQPWAKIMRFYPKPFVL
jgi:hypothetical protein